MRKIVRLTETDIKRLADKVVNAGEQEKPDPNAVKSMNDLIKNIQSGFCVPTYQEGGRTRVDCKDKKYYEINHYRRFGQ